MVFASFLAAVVLDVAARVGLRFTDLGRWALAVTRGADGVEAERASRRERAQTRARLAMLLRLDPSLLPPDGGWGAAADFLLLLAEHVLTHRPQLVVEFGSGVSSLVIARCLQLNGSGRLLSFDHHPGFAELTRRRIARIGAAAEVRAVPLGDGAPYGYSGDWYQVGELPDGIDLVVIDGPPAWREGQAEARGPAGATAFPRLASGATVILDDAARPGEQAIAQRWRAEFPQISFDYRATEKGTLVGTYAG